MKTKHLDFPLSLKQIDAEGFFAGYASVFNVVDEQKDVILHGAFRDTLQTKQGKIKLLWQHKTDEPIGVFHVIREDAQGLYVEGRLLLDVARAREAYALLKSGAMNGLSIGYQVKNHDYDAKTGVRLIIEAELFEVSLVTFPANSEATVRAVKALNSLPVTIRGFEGLLRELGYSRKRAKEIALKGFDGLPETQALDAGESKQWNAAMLSGEAIRLADALEKATRILHPC